MLKEVGSSGQISLGKKFAGKLYDMQFLETGEVRLKPMKAVEDLSAQPSNSQERSLRRPSTYKADTNEQALWEQDNKCAIEAFNQRIEAIGSPAMRHQAWRGASRKQAA
jgi:hypothetical protein